MKFHSKSDKLTAPKSMPPQRKIEDTLELIKRIEKADKFASSEVVRKTSSEKLQILPGYQTGIVSLLCW